MRLATVEEAREIDRSSIERFGLSGEILMESASVLSANEIKNSFSKEQLRSPVILCGPGNNGADGLVVARLLPNARVLILAPEEKQSDLFRLQLKRLRAQEIKEVTSFEGATLVVDALFGVGFRGRLEGEALELVKRVNRARIPVVSLDVPSGLDANRGVSESEALRANLTLTFGLAKPGFFISDGPSHVGLLKILKIGFPQAVEKEIANSASAFTLSRARKALNRRVKPTAHKSDRGHALIIAGSDGFEGAARLAASAAFRAGSGYVSLASNFKTNILPEALTAQVTDEKLWKNPKWRAAGIGPGLGVSSETKAILEKLRAYKNVVVDADAITVIAENKMTNLPPTWVLTPHAGELSRILKVSAREIESDRLRFAREASDQLGCHVLLKGFRTVIAHPGGKTTVNLSGNAALAKAGTGDVLTGIITSFMSQGYSSGLAAALGAYIHGRLADEWIKEGNSQRSLSASDLIERLPKLLKKLATR